ncbi:hypothetical protein BGW38_009217 [Lunasporangiospora selenospora]|uniref:Uncharacterized protein n=1 Tax=Lunasporangiospora selenospora TaxID=979761 RepID=A0A9P6FXQ7_9FUNG|nr:hypothetical protein BGW38_009217 [Lunasporangiospora selenospora]
MENKDAQTDDTGAATPASRPTTASNQPSHPPPTQFNNHHQQPSHNIQRIRHHGPHAVGAVAGGLNGVRNSTSPSIRQSWLFPTNRASPSTGPPETTSVMTLNQRSHNRRSDASVLASSSSVSAVGSNSSLMGSSTTSATASFTAMATTTSSSTVTSTTSSHMITSSVPPSATINHPHPRDRRNINGSARSRLSRIDQLSRMMLSSNASGSNQIDPALPSPTTPISSQRSRLSLQSPISQLAAAAAAAATTEPPFSAGPMSSTGASGGWTADATSLAKTPASVPESTIPRGLNLPEGAEELGQNHAVHLNSNTSYPRHILVRSTSPQRGGNGRDSGPVVVDEFSSSLPLPSFAAGVDVVHNSNSVPSTISGIVAAKAIGERAGRHASMPLPRPAWRLQDHPDPEPESNEPENEDEPSDPTTPQDQAEDPSGWSTSKTGFQYSSTNASSTTLDQPPQQSQQQPHPYSYLSQQQQQLQNGRTSHSRQVSTTSTYYTMTPNASNLDLSQPPTTLATAASSLVSLSLSTDPPISATSPSSSSTFDHGPGSSQGPSHPPLARAHKPSKTPLVIKRSSTNTISSAYNYNTFASNNTFSINGIHSNSSNLNDSIHANNNNNNNSINNDQYPHRTLTRERQKIILEILRTERTYVHGLMVLNDLFYTPLSAPYMNNTSAVPNSPYGPAQSHLNRSTTSLHGTLSNGASGPSNHGVGTLIGMGAGPGPLHGTGPTGMNTVGSNYSYSTSTLGSNATMTGNNMTTAAGAPYLPERSVSIIFSGLGDVLFTNSLLLTDLEERICGSSEYSHSHDNGGDGEDEDEPPNMVWVPYETQGGQRQEILVLEEDWCVGDIFKTMAPYLKTYSNFVMTHSTSLAHINECMSRNDRFAEFIRTTERRPECKSLSFQSHLLLPVQRIPRYKLLIESLLKHTPADHPDHRHLQEALQRMDHTASVINEKIRHHEMSAKMVELQSKITGMPDRLVVAGREFIRRGLVQKICRRNIQPRVLLLFTDCLIWTSPGMNPLDDKDTMGFHRKNPLEHLTVIMDGVDMGPMSTSISGASTMNNSHSATGATSNLSSTPTGASDPPSRYMFHIMSSEKSSAVYVEDAKERQAWVDAIRKATQEHIARKRTLKPAQKSISAGTAIAAGLSGIGGLSRRETGFWSYPFGGAAAGNSNVGYGGDSKVNVNTTDDQVYRPRTSIDSVVGVQGGTGAWTSGANGGASGADSSSGAYMGAYGGAYREGQNGDGPGISSRPNQPPLRVVENFNAPVWIPDQNAARCMICSEDFSALFRRKHHCRLCGKVVCRNCSTRRVLIKAADTEKPGRACDDCYFSMFPEDYEQELAVPPPPLTTEPMTMEQEKTDRRASQHSMDGYVVRPEDYTSESGGLTTGAAGMVRGFVEASLSRMKSRSNTNQDKPTVNTTESGTAEINSPGAGDQTPGQEDPIGAIKERRRERGSNRRSDCFSSPSHAEQNIASIKSCGLCKEEFTLFKWRNVCQQCRRVVCSNCLTKRQLDHFFLMGLEVEGQLEKEQGSSSNSYTDGAPEGDARKDLTATSGQSDTKASHSIAGSSGSNTSTSSTSLSSNTSVTVSPSATVGTGFGWRGSRANTDSGHGQAEKLCDPCYMGLSADQVQVLESGGGWHYYQATLSRAQSQGVAAALAKSPPDDV